MAKTDVVTWNALISGYSHNGYSDKAFELCQKMQKAGINPDSVTFLSLVGVGNFFRSRSEYYDPNVIARKVEFVSKLFNNLPTKSLAAWSAMIATYAEHGFHERAIFLYLELLQQNLKPDNVTFVCVLKACGDLQMGKCVHFHIIESGCKLDLQLRNCLVDLYGQNGGLEDARVLFESMPDRCVVTWSSMISAYVQYGKNRQCLELLNRMLQGDIKPNEVTYFCAMRSCANMAALILSLLVYTHIVDNGWDCHEQVKNSAIDMFAKCGSMADAFSMFQGMNKRSVATWSAMISAYALHGEHNLSLECFNDMVQEGIKPNSVTYVCLVSACYSLGFASHGRHHLHTMQNLYGIKLGPEHRNCMVELYGRTGQLKEAADFLQGIPSESDIAPWVSLLNQCKAHGNVNMAKQCFGSMGVMESTDAFNNASLRESGWK